MLWIGDTFDRAPRIRAAETCASVRSGQVGPAICPVELLDDDPDVHFTPRLSARNVIVCRTGHPLLRKQNPTLPDILRFSWVSTSAATPPDRICRSRRCILARVQWTSCCRINTSAGAADHLPASDSLAVLPQNLAHAMSQLSLTHLTLTLPVPQRHVSVRRCAPETASRRVKLAPARLNEGSSG